MGTITKNYTENAYSSNKASWVVNLTTTSQTVSGNFTLSTPTITAKMTASGKTRGFAEVDLELNIGRTLLYSYPSGGYTFGGTPWASGATKTLAKYGSNPTITLSNIFNSNNKGSRTYNVTATTPSNADEIYLWSSANYDSTSGDYGAENWYTLNSGSISWGTVCVLTLNAPPTVELGTPTYASPQYTGLGAYTVPLTKLKGQYGGDITKVTLTVGTDSTTQTYSANEITNQTISVIPTVDGTFTPTLTVTDSRTQTTMRSFTDITVGRYDIPSVNFDIYRTDNTGVKNDEGDYGLIEADISFTSTIATLTKPEVKIDGTTTNNVVWYSSAPPYNSNSTPISDWSSITYSGTTPPKVYGLINGSFGTEQSYQITVIETDSLNKPSTPITQTLSTAYYTIDFQAGGKEIAFGAPANDDLTNYNGNDWSGDGVFKCAMHTDFIKDVNAPNIQQIQSVIDDIGTFYYNTASKAITTAGIDATPTKGAAITVTKGTYVVVGQWAFNTRTSTGNTNSQVQLFKGSTSFTTHRVLAAGSNWNCLQTTGIVQVTADNTELSVRASTSITYTTATNNYIWAVRII